MKQLTWIIRLSILLATFSLVIEFAIGLRSASGQFSALGQYSAPVFLLLIPGLIWWASLERREPSWLKHPGSHRVHSWMLVIFTFLAALGILTDGPPLLGLLAILASLVAWDSAHLLQRLAAAPDDDAIRYIFRQHYSRLLVIIGVGLVLVVLANQIHIQLKLSLAILLGMISIISLSQIIGFLHRESQ